MTLEWVLEGDRDLSAAGEAEGPVPDSGQVPLPGGRVGGGGA